MVGGRSAGGDGPADGVVRRGLVGRPVRGQRAAGNRGEGGFRCGGCGYGIAVAGVLPRCPMCGGTSWQPDRGRPFARSLMLDRDVSLP